MPTPFQNLRLECADLLESRTADAAQLKALVGLDGFVDEIVHLVRERHNAESYERLGTITDFAKRVAAAAGRSTNIEPVTQRFKLGGNGPIMAHALASTGVQVTYVGTLGWPVVHPVFEKLQETAAAVHSIGEPGRTTALEFLDGKVMLTNSSTLGEVTWGHLEERFGQDKLMQLLLDSDLSAFVNWTMIPYMSAIWSSMQAWLDQRDAALPRRRLFIDLADPEKRSQEDIQEALELLAKFQHRFDVTLGLNEKEAWAIASVLGLTWKDQGREQLGATALEMASQLGLETLVIHPVRHALAVVQGELTDVDGPVTDRPKITTGAGDHFNAGFMLARTLGLPTIHCLLTGVTTSGYYVREAHSPAIPDLAGLLRRIDEPYG